MSFVTLEVKLDVSSKIWRTLVALYALQLKLPTGTLGVKWTDVRTRLGDVDSSQVYRMLLVDMGLVTNVGALNNKQNVTWRVTPAGIDLLESQEN